MMNMPMIVKDTCPLCGKQPETECEKHYSRAIAEKTVALRRQCIEVEALREAVDIVRKLAALAKDFDTWGDVDREAFFTVDERARDWCEKNAVTK